MNAYTENPVQDPSGSAIKTLAATSFDLTTVDPSSFAPIKQILVPSGPVNATSAQ